MKRDCRHVTTPTQKNAVTADLRTAEGIRDAEAFFVSLLGESLRPSKDGQTPLKLVGAAPGIKHQVQVAGCLSQAEWGESPRGPFPS